MMGIISDAVGAQDVARDAGTFQSHPHVVALDERDVLVANRAGVLEAADVEREQLGLGDFIGHPHKLFLDNLVAGNRLVAELLAEFGVLERGVVAGHGRADGSPGDAVTRLIEAHEGALDADGAGHGRREWHVHVLKRKAAGVGSAQLHLP